jgi:ribosomal protein L15
MNDISTAAAAAALGKKGGAVKSEGKAAAAKANGAKGGRPPVWHKAPARGCTNPKSEMFRFTVVRLSDRAERFTDRKPKPGPFVMVWDNRENCEVR